MRPCVGPARCSRSPTRPIRSALEERELADRVAHLSARATAAAQDVAAAEERLRAYSVSGGGPAERELLGKRGELAGHLRRIDAAITAREQLRHAKQERERAREHGGLDAAEEVYRSALERVREAAAQAPPQTVWPLIRHQHAQMIRHWDDLVLRARHADIRAADAAVTARTRGQEIRAELDAVQQEIASRAAQSPERLSIEQAAREEHRARQRRQELIAALAATPDVIGLLGDEQLAARVADLRQRLQDRHAATVTAEETLARWTEHGGGRLEQQLKEDRAELTERLQRIDTAHEATQHRDQITQCLHDLARQSDILIQRAHQARRELTATGRLLPSSRARRWNANLTSFGETMHACRSGIATCRAVCRQRRRPPAPRLNRRRQQRCGRVSVSGPPTWIATGMSSCGRPARSTVSP